MIKKTLVFTATLNEYPNIKILLRKLTNFKKSIDILVIDDNSNDGTLDYLKSFAQKNSFLKLIIRKNKLGLDTAHKEAFAYAKKKNIQI